jgi:hypothetical protein
LNFTDGSNGLDGVGTSVSALLQVQLTAHSDAILVERAELTEVLAEQEFTPKRCRRCALPPHSMHGRLRLNS